MKLKYLFSVVLMCLIIFSNAQSKEEKLMEQWRKIPNCCVWKCDRDSLKGFFLDGKKIVKYVVPTFLNGVNNNYLYGCTDSTGFEITIDTNDVYAFEKAFADTLANDSSLVLNTDAYCPKHLYYRQYLKCKDTLGQIFLIVGFHTERDLKCINGKYHYPENSDSSKLELSELTCLISERIWINNEKRWNIPSYDEFFVVFNIQNHRMRFLYTIPY